MSVMVSGDSRVEPKGRSRDNNVTEGWELVLLGTAYLRRPTITSHPTQLQA